jgi:hypothetical protein
MSRIFDAVRRAEIGRMNNMLPRAVRDDVAPAAPSVQQNADALAGPTALNATSAGGPSMNSAAMGETSFRENTCGEIPNSSAPRRQERRKDRRTCIRLPVRVRPANSQDGYFEEILETVNSSKGGLKFVTTSGRFYPGMRILTTFPYSCGHDRVTSVEENGVVERLESISNKALGVAVRLTKTGGMGQVDATVRPYAATNVPSIRSDAQVRPGTERRMSVRKPFSASATAVEENSETRLQVRCSDLCLDGCYVDTLNPFPDGTSLTLRIKNKEATFETPARVCSSHIGMGMGLVFCDTAEEQKATLAEWLGDKSREVSYR